MNLIEAIKPNLDWNYYIYSPDSEFEIQYDYDNTAYWGSSLQQGKFSLRIVAYDGYGQVKAVDCIVTKKMGWEKYKTTTTNNIKKKINHHNIVPHSPPTPHDPPPPPPPHQNPTQRNHKEKKILKTSSG